MTLVHVGYPKAASTWLQRNVFDRSTLGFCTPWAGVTPTTPGRSFAARRWTDAGRSGAEAVAAFAAAALPGGLQPVLSEETLVGYIGDPGPDVERLRRLVGLLPDARCLLVTRERRGLARSAFRQSGVDGGTSGPSHFLAADGSDARTRDPRRLHAACFDANAVEEALGADRVTRLEAGWLRPDRDAARAALGRWAGRPVPVPDAAFDRRENASAGAAGTEALRRLNAAWPRSSPWCPRWQPLRQAVALTVDRLAPAAWERRLREREDAGVAAFQTRG